MAGKIISLKNKEIITKEKAQKFYEQSEAKAKLMKNCLEAYEQIGVDKEKEDDGTTKALRVGQVQVNKIKYDMLFVFAPIICETKLKDEN